MKKLIAFVGALALFASAWTTYNTTGSFHLSWDYTGPTNALSGFTVYYGPNSFYDSAGVPLATLPPGAGQAGVAATERSYNVTSLPVGLKYYFVVTATAGGLESLPSNQLTNTVPLVSVPSPTNARTP